MQIGGSCRSKLNDVHFYQILFYVFNTTKEREQKLNAQYMLLKLLGQIAGRKNEFDSVVFTIKEGNRLMQSIHFIGVASIIGKGRRDL